VFATFSNDISIENFVHI